MNTYYPNHIVGNNDIIYVSYTFFNGAIPNCDFRERKPATRLPEPANSVMNAYQYKSVLLRTNKYTATIAKQRKTAFTRVLAAEILTTETAAIRTNFAAESVSQI